MRPELDEAASENARDYLPFEVVSEPWSRYKLSDGTFLRLRFLLLKMRRVPSTDPALPYGAEFNSQLIVVVEPPARYRGKPGPALSPDQLQATMEDEPTAEVIADPPSVYRFEGDRKLVVNTKVIRAQRSSKCGPDGDRLYAIGTASEVAIMGGPVPGAANIVPELGPPPASNKPL